MYGSELGGRVPFSPFLNVNGNFDNDQLNNIMFSFVKLSNCRCPTETVRAKMH